MLSSSYLVTIHAIYRNTMQCLQLLNSIFSNICIYICIYQIVCCTHPTQTASKTKKTWPAARHFPRSKLPASHLGEPSSSAEEVATVGWFFEDSRFYLSASEEVQLDCLFLIAITKSIKTTTYSTPKNKKKTLWLDTCHARLLLPVQNREGKTPLDGWSCWRCTARRRAALAIL